MINNIINNFKNLDKLARTIMNNGLKFCFILGIIALAILITYNLSFTVPIIFSIGFGLFKLSMIFGIEFIICGFVADKIKKQLI